MTGPSSSERARLTLGWLALEAIRAENEWAGLLALQRAKAHGMIGLLNVAYQAMFNSFAARMMRIYDERPDVASIWYLLRVDRELARDFENEGLTEAAMKAASAKLKHVRDKVLMHFDKKYINSLRRAWDESGLKGRDISALIRQTARALRAAHQTRFGAVFAVESSYDAKDLPAILAALRTAGLLPDSGTGKGQGSAS